MNFSSGCAISLWNCQCEERGGHRCEQQSSTKCEQLLPLNSSPLDFFPTTNPLHTSGQVQSRSAAGRQKRSDVAAGRVDDAILAKAVVLIDNKEALSSSAGQTRHRVQHISFAAPQKPGAPSSPLASQPRASVGNRLSTTQLPPLASQGAVASQHMALAVSHCPWISATP